MAAPRHRFATGIEECNVDCYSDCAYNGYYFFRSMPAAVMRHPVHRPRWRDERRHSRVPRIRDGRLEVGSASTRQLDGCFLHRSAPPG